MSAKIAEAIKAQAALLAATSEIDKAAKKGVISKNTANRKKSRAQLKLNKAKAAAATKAE